MEGNSWGWWGNYNHLVATRPDLVDVEALVTYRYLETVKTGSGGIKHWIFITLYINGLS